MQFDDFLGQVQHRAHLPDTEAALRASRATLTTLSERLAGGEPADLAAQLPREFLDYVVAGGSGLGERFDSNEFFRRVSEREGTDLPVAVHHARVVLEVLGQAVSPGEIRKVRGQLPQDYQRLFESGSEGSLQSG